MGAMTTQININIVINPKSVHQGTQKSEHGNACHQSQHKIPTL